VYSTHGTQHVWLAMEDDCWNIEALRGVNSLAASVALKKSLMVSVRLSLILSDRSDPTIYRMHL
jgi:hypothetical protein